MRCKGISSLLAVSVSLLIYPAQNLFAALDNIENDLTKTYNHDSAQVTCTDCHNPHPAASGNHTIETNTVSNALQGVTGVTPSFSASNWGGVSSYSDTAAATYEYEICFKCHSGAIGDPATWSGTSGAGAWTDVGLEFNPNNQSRHPVVSALPAYNTTTGANHNSGLHANQLIGVDRTWSQGSVMYCSDCHASDSSAAGPHGSATKWMLTGTYKNWPYQSAADNGQALPANSSYAYLNSGAAGTTFCQNCHPAVTSSNSNNAHTTGDHVNSSRGRCVNCHIRVPHGGRVSRLISAANPQTDLPARYWPDGNGGPGGSYNQPEMSSFRRKAYRSYSQSGDCEAGCYGGHSSSGDESW